MACPYGTFWGDGEGGVVWLPGQAQGLPLRNLLGGWRGRCGLAARAGTRPAPTEPFGGMARAVWFGCQGRHKACPYGTFWGDGEGGVVWLPGQAQGLPLRNLLGGWRGRCGLAARAGTRPAPTEPFGGMARAVWFGCQGRHKACPYGTFWGDGEGGVVWLPGQAQGLPLRNLLGGILLARHYAGEE